MKTELIGLELLKNVELRCSECRAYFGEVILVEDNKSRKERKLKPQRVKFVVKNCPICNNPNVHTDVLEGTTALKINENFQSISEEYDVDSNKVMVQTLVLKKI